MAGKKDMEDLATQVAATPGWTADRTAAGHHIFTNTATGDQVLAAATPSSSRTFANVKAELRRKGWNEDAAQLAKDETRAAKLAADKELGEKLLTSATKAATARTRAAATKTAPEPEVIKPATNPFIKPQITIISPIPPEDSMAPAHNPNPFPLSARDPAEHDLYWVTAEMADKALEKGPCKQRKVYDTNVAKLVKTMETGRFRDNKADHIVFDIHGCCSNGQHRLFAIIDTDPDKLKQNYPNGVPLRCQFGADPEDTDIYDSGRARTVRDTLDVAGHEEFGSQGAAVLRLIMNFDTRGPWTNWNHNIWTNDEFKAAARGGLKDVAAYLAFSQHINRKSALTKSVGAAVAFLLDRDNPGGGGKDHPERTNEMFWKGVCFETTLEPDDPRAALYKFLKGIKDDKNRTVKTPIILGHVLRQYANWHLNEKIVNSRQDEDWPMPQVWQPGMKFINGQLRHPQRIVNNRSKKV